VSALVRKSGITQMFSGEKLVWIEEVSMTQTQSAEEKARLKKQ